MQESETDMTLLDELSCFIGEENAETVWSILSAVESSVRIVQTESYFVVITQKNLSSQEQIKLTSLLQSKLVSIPPSEGRAVYLKLGDGYAIVAQLSGAIFSMIVVAKGELCGEGVAD